MAEENSSGYRTKRQQYQQLRSALLLERATYENHWRDLGDYILPRRLRFFVSDRNKGERRNQKIIDSTATFGARTLQSGLHSGITSPARPWFRLTVPDSEMAEYGAVKAWLHLVTQRISTIFLRSNLYNALPVIYGDLGVFGTAAMAVMEDDDDLIRCYPYPIGSYALGLSRRQIVDTLVRDYQMTVRQLVEEFGIENVSESAKRSYEKGDYEIPREVCWVVQPNPDADPDRLEPKYLPFTSCWFELGAEEDKYLRESGFNEFPILAPRWSVTGEDYYGTDSPGMTCLGDVRQLQLMQKKKAQAVEKMINPPLTGPASLRNQKISLLPGDYTASDMATSQQGLRPIFDLRLSVQELTLDIQDTRFLINQAFFVPLFLMLASSDAQRTERTAREIEERHEEKLLMLGPVLERLNDELLDPLIDRTFAIMQRKGLIPPAPEELQGQALRVEYISLMAAAQKLVGAVGMDRFLGSTVPLTEVMPKIKHKIRPMQIVDEYADIYGVNPNLVVPDDEAEAAFNAEREAAMASVRAEQMNLAAKSAKDLGQTPVGGGDTALDQLMTGVGA